MRSNGKLDDPSPILFTLHPHESRLGSHADFGRLSRQARNKTRIRGRNARLLVRILGNVTATQSMMLRLGQMQDEGSMLDEHASLAKAFCTVNCRETVGYARELLGGNGILLENHIGRFVADAEAIYSYEGTREMNTLIVGKSITGLSAFV